MPRILLVAQDKGGSGKTVLVRALAECLPSAHLIEIEANRRLIELEDRVSFFPVRAERGEINRTGGAAARAEFDGPLNAIAGAQGPVIVDVGANTAGSLLPLIGEAQARYARRGVEFALLVVLTSEPGALANAPVLLDLARPFTAARFAVENQIEGAIDPKALKAFAKDVALTRLEKLSLDERANELLQKGGLRFIGEDLTAAEDSLTGRYGFAEAGRIIEDLTGFRSKAMQAAGPAARWLEG
ncbi:hypothetical protein [Methylobacterium sp. yr596]|uniref:hypothetical protein n=1 Tax=Methylobacterium sp. yr596 TaxID=1761800 RepID=UPI0008EA2DE0|nr:hypothetical protein [Methylobacterium sp. yr596]SFF72235.1 hypothetical protein SAMN04487844_14225 [Methylobacterium sp. yr596]